MQVDLKRVKEMGVKEEEELAREMTVYSAPKAIYWFTKTCRAHLIVVNLYEVLGIVSDSNYSHDNYNHHIRRQANVCALCCNCPRVSPQLGSDPT